MVHYFGESERTYKARVLNSYAKYLRAKYTKAGLCVRAFMHATKKRGKVCQNSRT
jgi:hypothetical protein